MPSHIEKLRATIQDLEQELASLDSLDSDSRALLETAAAEIEDALHKDDHTSIASDTAPVTTRLTEAAHTFETSHPTLAGVVQKLIDALGQLGI